MDNRKSFSIEKRKNSTYYRNLKKIRDQLNNVDASNSITTNANTVSVASCHVPEPVVVEG